MAHIYELKLVFHFITIKIQNFTRLVKANSKFHPFPNPPLIPTPSSSPHAPCNSIIQE